VVERIQRSASQLKQGDLLITAGTYEEFDHPREISSVVVTGPDVRVSFTDGGRQKVFNRDTPVYIVDSFRSPNVTAETKECANCSEAMPKDSAHTECRRCRTRPLD
jgi:hypothetical protein